MRSSLAPYESDVSRKLMPAASAASSTGGTSWASIENPKLFVPSPITDTCKEPIVRISMRT